VTVSAAVGQTTFEGGLMDRQIARWTIGGFIWLAVATMFATYSPASAQAPAGDRTVGSKVISSEDGLISLTVPDGWDRATGLNAAASIQTSNPAENLYALVVTDIKEDLSPGITLEKYAMLAVNKLIGSLTEVESVGPQRLVVNGQSAVLYEIRGTINNVRAAYYFAVIETGKYFHQVGIWTSNSKFEARSEVMRSIITSFRETSKPAGGN
jgi:hypothetical protein